MKYLMIKNNGAGCRGKVKIIWENIKSFLLKNNLFSKSRM
jgi:hypothetical protein